MWSLRRLLWKPHSWMILGADSLDIFQIVMGIEEGFDIEIPTEATERIVTVGDAAEQIKNALN